MDPMPTADNKAYLAIEALKNDIIKIKNQFSRFTATEQKTLQQYMGLIHSRSSVVATNNFRINNFRKKNFLKRLDPRSRDPRC